MASDFESEDTVSITVGSSNKYTGDDSMKGYLYAIISPSGKQYVGKTYLTIKERFEQHCKEAHKERSKHRPIYRAFNKYGSKMFVRELAHLEEGELEIAEIQYIKDLDTYHNGYNATLGGDGKRYIEATDQEIIGLYKELHQAIKVAEAVGCCADTVSAVLHANGIRITNGSDYPIYCINKIGDKKEFDTFGDAAQWLIDNNLTVATFKSVRKGIGKAIRGERHSYLKMKWGKL